MHRNIGATIQKTGPSTVLYLEKEELDEYTNALLLQPGVSLSYFCHWFSRMCQTALGLCKQGCAI